MSTGVAQGAVRRRRLRRLLLVPGALVGLLGLLTLGAFVRGTWADSQPRVPATVEEGPVCQVYDSPEDGRQVRCALLLPYTLEEVWQVVTDYDNYGDICSCIRADQIVHEPDGRCLLEAKADSGLASRVPFAVELRHDQELFRRVVSWDQPDGNVLVNRGKWVLTPDGPGRTLLVLSLEVQVRGVPTFVLRNQSLHRLREVVLGVERRLRTGGTGKKW
jgi:hypothetical protein